MFRTLAPRRRAAVSALLGTVFGTLAMGATAAPARAQATTLTFDTLRVTDGSGIRYVDNCYKEAGFVVTAVGVACGTATSFATVSADDPTLWTGTPALFLNDAVATSVSFARADGGMFSMQSIGLAGFLGAAANVTLTGYLMGGSTVTQTCAVSGSAFGANPPMQACALGGAFSGLASVQFAALNAFGEPLAEFDNVVVTPAATAVPEPATVVLFGAGLLAVGGAARRRRQPQAA